MDHEHPQRRNTSFSGVLGRFGRVFGARVYTDLRTTRTKHGRREMQGSEKKEIKRWETVSKGGGCKGMRGRGRSCRSDGHEIVQGDGDGSGERCNVSKPSNGRGTSKKGQSVGG
jgi:hypothetical protein